MTARTTRKGSANPATNSPSIDEALATVESLQGLVKNLQVSLQAMAEEKQYWVNQTAALRAQLQQMMQPAAPPTDHPAS